MKRAIKIIAVLIIIAAVVASIIVTVQDSNNNKFKTTDYSNSDNWMYAQTDGDEEVDLFYIYPTVAMVSDRDDGCANITDQMKKDAQTSFNITAYAFEGYTNVYAPYYRQVGLDTAAEIVHHDDYYDFLKNSTAAKDIFASLDYYFAHYNEGRPFMLAGHSQGSAMVLIVLDVYMEEHPEIYSRMVAAYAIGFGVTQSYLDSNPHLKMATGATDTQVIISWNTEGIPKDGIYKESLMIGENTRLINPITWSCNTSYVDKSNNRGELKVLDSENYTITTVAGVNDARINSTRGSLICTTNTNFADSSFMGDVSLHGWDYPLYFREIQINGFDRIAAYLGHRPMTSEALDYSNADNWMKYGYTTGAGTQTVDVFYIYPTCSSADTIVGDVDESMMRLANYAYEINASSMAGYTNIYAPYYRQISNYGISQSATTDLFEDTIAREVTRTDVYAALDYFFDNCNEGRPFILAGHSQGSANLKLVLSEYMKMPEHKDYMERMVAAYAIGFKIDQAWLTANDLTFASSADDTGVIISWNTYANTAEAGTGSACIGEGCMAINPLNWETDDTPADKSENKGSYYVDMADPSVKVMYYKKASAQLSSDPNEGGMVITAVDDGTLFTYTDSSMLGKDNYHSYDWALFYENIKLNGQERIDAYFAK